MYDASSENYSNIQEPTNKQNLEDISQYKFKTEYAIYLMECTMCNLHYVGQNKTPFNIRRDNHRKDLKYSKAILADKHFKKSGHRFKKHPRFMIVNRLTNTNLDKEILRERLIQRENIWTQKLQSQRIKSRA